MKAIAFIHIALVQLAKIFIIAMVMIIFANVILRYVFNSGILWSEEVCLLLSVWFIFISMGLGVKQRLNITINLLPKERIPRWLDRALELLTEIVIITVGGIFIIYGATLVKFTMTSIMPATMWPAGMLYFVVPLAGGIIICEAVLHVLGWDDYDSIVDNYLSGQMKLKELLGGRHA